MHLHGQNELLLEDRTLLQATNITAVQPVAPAAAHRARCPTDRAACFDGERISLRVAVHDALAHAGQDSVKPAKHLVHDEAADELHRPEVKTPRGSSHRLRETRAKALPT